MKGEDVLDVKRYELLARPRRHGRLVDLITSYAANHGASEVVVEPCRRMERALECAGLTVTTIDLATVMALLIPAYRHPTQRHLSYRLLTEHPKLMELVGRFPRRGHSSTTNERRRQLPVLTAGLALAALCRKSNGQ